VKRHTHESLVRARTLLFVPGHREDRFAKAAASGADDIIIDLEDAVAVELKSLARENLSQWREAGGGGLVRINDATTPFYEDDIAALIGRPCTVMLPKVDHADQVNDLVSRLPKGSRVVPVLETASGVLNALPICSAQGVVRAAFGNGDLATELGIGHDDRLALAHARSSIVLASAAAGIAEPLDGVTTELRDERMLATDSKHAAALGFGGKLCVHPRQVPVVQTAFMPSAEQLRWAAEVVAAAGDGSVTTVHAQMIDKPIVERARRLLSN
jgi:citrate lyase subunit beta / citryl-CoA lyase